jgi:hypothetical protein
MHSLQPLRVSARLAQNANNITKISLTLHVLGTQTCVGSSQPTHSDPSMAPTAAFLPMMALPASASGAECTAAAHSPACKPNPILPLLCWLLSCSVGLSELQVQQCHSCKSVYCSSCSVINYDEWEDRIFCLDCNEDSMQVRPGAACFNSAMAVLVEAAGNKAAPG